MRTHQNRAGVSVVDVVVALAIIILLAAVLFPVLQPCRDNPRKSTCHSNLKECALAMQLYWGDYDGHLPSSALVSHAKKWNKADFRTFATKLGKLPAKPTMGRSWVQIVYDKMKNKDIMFCPSDMVDQKDPKSYCSYWYKTAIDKAWYGEGCKKPCRRESDYAYNSDIIMLYEHTGWHFGDQSGLKNGVQINVAFMDTHVKTVSLVNATSGDPVNCAANSDGEPMYFNFDNTKKKAKGNPPARGMPAKYVDPGRYSDLLP